MRIGFLHPYKMSDHYFVEAIETATITDLIADGHEAEAVDFLFEHGRSESEQIAEMRGALEEARYDLLFLERPWSDEMVRALQGLPLVAYGRPELVERGLVDLGVISPGRRTVRALVSALAAQDDISNLPGIAFRRNGSLIRVPPVEQSNTLTELSDARFDYTHRRTLSRRSANTQRAVVLSNIGCAYRNTPNRTGIFDGVSLPRDISTAGCTFCDAAPYERMTEAEAIDLIVKQVEAVLRDRPEVREIALKDDYAVRFLGSLGDALSAFDLGDREILLSARADYLLEFREQIEEALSGRFPTPLGFYLLGFENFSQPELDRFNKGIGTAQIERVLVLMREWTERFPGRFRLSPTGGFILFTPWTTLEDLRANANVIRQHGFERYRGRALLSQLRLYPNLPLYWLAKHDGLLASDFDHPEMSDARRRGYEADVAWRFRDERVASVHKALLDAASLSDAELFQRFEDALDDAAGIARGKKHRPLRMVRAPRDVPRKAALSRQVSLNRSCNQTCSFCTYRGKETQDPRARAAQAIAAVREAAQQGVTRLIVTGGEPLLEWYLPDLVRLARSLGIEEVILETNAIQLEDHGGARALFEAGVTRARVALNAFDPAISDAITQDIGGHAKTIAGIRAFMTEGIDVELAFALRPKNRGELARIALRLRELFPDAEKLPAIIVRYVHSTPPGGTVLDIADAANELLEGARAARAADVVLRPAPGTALPPCVFPDFEEARGVLHLGEAIVAHESHHYDRIPTCETCTARAVCPGAPKKIANQIARIAKPLGQDAAASELLPATRVRQQMLSEYRSQLFYSDEGRRRERRIVRLNFHCNQACDFCFVSRELPPIEHELIVREIEDAAERGALLDFSGGEPTLNPRLLEYIRLARSLGVQVELQTNAIKMADSDYAQSLADAGLESVFISLHGVTAAVSDRVTAAPGTFEKTMAGIKNLIALGLDVWLNFVLCGYNIADLAELPDFAYRELVAPIRGARLSLNFSFVAASTGNVPRDTGLIPRFSSVAWALERCHERAMALGFTLNGFDSKCGVPACYLPKTIREQHFEGAIPEAERKRATGFTKSPACAECEHDSKCYGIRSSYAEMYGIGELRPIRGGEVGAVAEGNYADGPPWSLIGLASNHRLRADSSRFLYDDSAFLPASPTWAESLQPADKELAQLAVGLREVIKVERATPSAAEQAAQLFQARGLVTRIFVGPSGPGNSIPRALVFAGRSIAAVEEAGEIEAHLTGNFRERMPFVRKMGALLGYPDCCVEAFANMPEQDDATHIARLSRDDSGQLAPTQNWAAFPIRLFSHFPCAPSCAATARLGRATIDALAQESPRYAASLEAALRSVALVVSADCFVLLQGAAKVEGADAFTYSGTLSHRQLGTDDAVLSRLPFRAFYLEVIAPLDEGNLVRRHGDQLVVERDGRHVATITFAKTAPRLLDFTAARARRRLPTVLGSPSR